MCMYTYIYIAGRKVEAPVVMASVRASKGGQVNISKRRVAAVNAVFATLHQAYQKCLGQAFGRCFGA